MPNFGYETIGSAGYSPLNSTSLRYMYGSIFTCPANGTAQSLTVALKRSVAGSHQVNCAIYDHETNELVAQTTAQTLDLTTSYQWFTFVFASPPSLVAGKVYLLVACAQTSNRYVYIPYDDGETDQGHYGTHGGATFPNFPPYFAAWNHANRKYSIYCTYEAAGGQIYEIYVDAIAQSLSTPAPQCTFNIAKNASVSSQGLHASETTFNISKGAITEAFASAVVEVGEIKIIKLCLVCGDVLIELKTNDLKPFLRLGNIALNANLKKPFLILGDLAIQIQGS